MDAGPSGSSASSCGSKSRNRCVHCFANRVTHPYRRFFCFPKNPTMCKNWVAACNRQFLLEKTPAQLNTTYKVCSEHFSAADFATSSMYRLLPLACPRARFDVEAVKETETVKPEEMRKKLSIKLSVPSLEETAVASLTDPGISEDPYPLIHLSPLSASTPKQTETSLLRTTPRRNQRRKRVITPKTRKIKVLCTRIYHLKKKKNISKDRYIQAVILGIKPYVPTAVYNFIRTQLRMSAVSPRARRWSNDDKNLAVKLYLASPRAYNALARWFKFPTKKTVLKSISGISLETGFSATVLNALKAVSSNMKQRDKYCIISFDEMKLKSGLSYCRKSDLIIGYENYGPYSEPSPKLATHALVFMVRGLCLKWKQVFASFFSADTASSTILRQLVLDAVQKLQDCGLVPLAIVCDQGANNLKLYFKEFSVSEEKPYFETNGQKIYALFDPPHLLKCLRNNVRKYPVSFNNGKTALWAHIVAFYEFDVKQDHRLAPKLTAKHVNVDGLQAMNVSLAAQVFSRSVSAGLCYLSALNYLSGASSTADFCENVNDLFDSVNSRMLTHKNPLLQACSKKSLHLTQWEKSVEFVQSIEFQTGTKKIRFPCLSGWRITLSAFRALIPELLENVPSILMSRFNQDALENFFSQVRRKGGNNDHPTALNFLYRMRLLLAENLIKTCENTNCQADGDSVLVPVEVLSAFSADQSTMDNSLGIDSSFTSTDGLLIENIDDDIKKNGAAYVAGYLATKTMKKFPCEACKSDLLASDKDLSPETVFLYFKEYNPQSKGGLCYPSLEFLNLITRLGRKFSIIFDECCFKPNITQCLIQEFEQEDNKWLHCELHRAAVWEYVIVFYVRLMIFYKVKFISRNLKNKKKAAKKLNKLAV